MAEWCRAQHAIQLGPVRQPGKGRARVLSGIAVERAFTGETGQLPKEPQSDHLTPAERGLRTRADLRRQLRLTALVNHGVQGREEGIRVDHGIAPLQNRDWSCTLVAGCLPLKFQLVNSHQAFEYPQPQVAYALIELL
jgi:hypothetical protein